jgi:hypothetical protein
MTRGRLHAVLGCLVLGLLASVSALTTGAVAATPKSVTITADEFFGATGDTVIALEATGGMFGTLSTGTGESFQQTKGSVTSTGHRVPLVIHGVDVYTFGAGAITFNWQFNCMYTSPTEAVCSGPWHITSGTGAYEGARGGGTAIDLCVDHYDGPDGAYSATTCSDTLTGKIQVP